MTRLSVLASAVALLMGGFVFHSNRMSPRAPNTDIIQSTDGAYRDGLFVGRLAAKRGDAPHVLSGRWSTDAERTSFAAGYLRGYAEVHTRRPVR